MTLPLYSLVDAVRAYIVGSSQYERASEVDRDRSLIQAIVEVPDSKSCIPVLPRLTTPYHKSRLISVS